MNKEEIEATAKQWMKDHDVHSVLVRKAFIDACNYMQELQSTQPTHDNEGLTWDRLYKIYCVGYERDGNDYSFTSYIQWLKDNYNPPTPKRKESGE